MAIRPGDRFGPYEIVAAVGAGGMGEVYRAHDTRLDRFVAIKVLRRPAEGNDLAPRLEREARLIASLSHPHICPLFDIGEYEGAPFLVMEFLEGETLGARLRGGPLPLDQALRIAVEIASAMDAAHRRGVVHRDLKPANVMLTRSGAKLLDFGLARFGAGHPAAALAAVSSAQTTSTDVALRTTTGGTLPYMSPEQIEGKDADHRSDVFAFGAVLYEMITGRRAFPGERAGAIIAGILRGEPPSIRTVQPAASEALDDLVRTCLAADPAERWQNAGDLVRVLRLIAEGRVSSDKTATSGRVPRVSWRWAAVAAVVAVLLIVIALSFRPAPRESVHPRHVVVLPCRALNASEDRLYCDGIAETLTATLAHLSAQRDLQLTPASRVRSDGVSNIDQARTLLGATLVLEGSLLRSGEVVRLNYTLVDALTHQQLDAISLTAAARDPFALQDQLVEWAARVLELRVTTAERWATAAHGTEVADAYALNQQARGYLLNFHDPANIDLAVALLERALRLDPDYAFALAGSGEAYWRKYEATRDQTWVDRARAACERAVATNGKLAAAHQCLGTLYAGTGRYDEAVESFRRALEHDPTSDDAYLGLARAQERQGDLDAAERTYRLAVDRRPHYWAVRSWAGGFYMRRSRVKEAAEAYQQAVRLAPDNAPAHAQLAAAYLYLGQYGDALRALRASVAIAPSYAAYVNWGMTLYRLRRFDEAAAMLVRACDLRQTYQCSGNLARAYRWSGNRVAASQQYARAIELGLKELSVNPRDADAQVSLAEYYAKLGDDSAARRHVSAASMSRDPHLMFFVALVYAELGERPEALKWLQQAVDAKLPAAELRAWPELDALRADPRFPRVAFNNQPPTTDQ